MSLKVNSQMTIVMIGKSRWKILRINGDLVLKECRRFLSYLLEMTMVMMMTILQISINASESSIDGENSKNRTTSHTNSNSQVHGLHAMLLLGSFTEPEEGMTLYVMWNWWERMPLVAVSLEYMIACQCQVYFLNAVLPKDLLQNLDAQRCDSLGCECSFPDGTSGSNTGAIFRY